MVHAPGRLRSSSSQCGVAVWPWSQWDRSADRRPGRQPGSAVQIVVLLIPVLASLMILPACGSPSQTVPDSYLRVDIDESDPERLLRYYLGGYVDPVAADPFEAGLVDARDGRLYVDRAALQRHAPSAADLEDADGNGRLDLDELETFVERTYNTVRSVPESLAHLAEETGFDADDRAWFEVEVHGVMTTARRHVFVHRSAIRAALSDYERNGRRLIYPVGTSFIGEHRLDGELVETTVMRKREDGFWDFVVYGRDGALAPGTATPPRELKSPAQCVGCHFGNRLFEPERSFPARAAPGPHGPRRLYVDEPLRDGEVTQYFDEHRRRSDTVLGLYGTLFVAQLRAQRRSGTISPADAALLDSLDL